MDCKDKTFFFDNFQKRVCFVTTLGCFSENISNLTYVGLKKIFRNPKQLKYLIALTIATHASKLSIVGGRDRRLLNYLLKYRVVDAV